MATADFLIRGLVGVDTVGAERALISLDKRVSQVQGAMGLNFSKMQAAGGLALGALALGAADFAKHAISDFSRVATETLNIQRATGMTAQQASALRGVAQMLDIDIGALNRGFVILNKHLVDGGKNFTKYGLSVYDANGKQKSQMELLFEIADKYVALGRGIQGAALTQDAFGRGGRMLIPILQQGSAGLRRMMAEAQSLGVVLSEQDVQAMFKLGVQQRQLSMAWQGLEIQVARGLVPALSTVVTFLTRTVGALQTIPAPIKTAAVAGLVLVGVTVGLGLAIKVLRTSLAELGIGLDKSVADQAAAAAAAKTTTTALAEEGVVAAATGKEIEAATMTGAGVQLALPGMEAAGGMGVVVPPSASLGRNPAVNLLPEAAAGAESGAVASFGAIAGAIGGAAIALIGLTKLTIQYKHQVEGMQIEHGVATVPAPDRTLMGLGDQSKAVAQLNDELAGLRKNFRQGAPDVGMFNQELVSFQRNVLGTHQNFFQRAWGGFITSLPGIGPLHDALQAFSRPQTALAQAFGVGLKQSMTEAMAAGQLTASQVRQLTDQFNKMFPSVRLNADAIVRLAQAERQEADVARRGAVQKQATLDVQTEARARLDLQHAQLTLDQSQQQYDADLRAEHDLQITHQQDLMSLQQAVIGVSQAQLQLIDDTNALTDFQLSHQQNVLSVRQAYLSLQQAQLRYQQDLHGTAAVSQTALDAIMGVRDAQLRIQESENALAVDRRRGLGTLQDQISLEQAELDLKKSMGQEDALSLARMQQAIDLQDAQLGVDEAQHQVEVDRRRGQLGTLQGRRDELDLEKARLALREKTDPTALREQRLQQQQDLLAVKEAELGIKQAQQSVVEDAARYQHLIVQQQSDTLGLRQAQMGVVQAQKTISNEIYTQRELELRTKQDALGIQDAQWGIVDATTKLDQAMQYVIRDYRILAGLMGGDRPLIQFQIGGGSGGRRMAAGGHLNPGQSALVGEAGEEQLIVTGQGADVIPFKRPGAALARMPIHAETPHDRRGPIVGTLIVNEADASPTAIVRELAWYDLTRGWGAG